MSKDKSVLVCGIGDEASATARGLFAEGYGVALYRATAPFMLRRRMSFADAWYDGNALLDGVEARRADVNAEFLLGLRTREFIPLLRGRLSDAIENWPWDVVVATYEDREPGPTSLSSLADFTIGLGPGFTAGEDCDLVIETKGLDPGAIMRKGDQRKSSRARLADHASAGSLIPSPAAGLFRANVSIGVQVEVGALLGYVDDTIVASPVAGRILGVARKEQAVIEGAPIVEIVSSPTERVSGVSERNKLIARGVAFAIEMEMEGVKPFSFEDWR